MGKQTPVLEHVKELRSMMPERGSYEAIARMTKGLYVKGTIQAMFLGRRTMSPVVLEAAEKYVQTINPTINESTK